MLAGSDTTSRTDPKSSNGGQRLPNGCYEDIHNLLDGGSELRVPHIGRFPNPVFFVGLTLVD